MMTIKTELSTLEAPNTAMWLTLDNQFFAGEEAPPPPADNPEETLPVDITLTQAELDKKIEAEADRKLAKALEKKQAEWDASLAEKLKLAKKTADEYAAMTAKEREDAEYKTRLEGLEARERELNDRQLLSQIESDLKESELPASLAASLLSIGDNKKIKESIVSIKKDFDEAVNLKVKEALRQETPKKDGGGATVSVGTNFAKSANEQAKPIENTIWG